MYTSKLPTLAQPFNSTLKYRNKYVALGLIIYALGTETFSLYSQDPAGDDTLP